MLSLALIAAGCGHGGGEAPQAALRPATSGPAADYPMVLGAPFVVDGVTYTPLDAMNYDQVGYASIGGEGGDGVSLAHRTLPLPSYVEVTSLKTGKTILVRAERRGPMNGSNLVELSPAAAAQLGLEGANTPVRVRRVNPPEPERALLRAGGQAPARMDTPLALVAVLLRKLEPGAAAPVPAPIPSAMPVAVASPTPPPPPHVPVVGKPAVKPPLAVKPPVPPAVKPAVAPVAAGNVVVQVGAFSSAARAGEVARKLGGTVSPAGKLFRVRIGGFAGAADASGALAKAKAAGYSDARIQRAD